MTGPVAWDALPAWSGGTWYDTADLATIVQQVVDRSGWSRAATAWCSKSLAIRVTFGALILSTTIRSNAPVLNINYGADTGTDLSIPIVAGNDDMEERESGGISLTSTDLEMVHDLGGYDNQKIGLRFNAISVHGEVRLLTLHQSVSGPRDPPLMEQICRSRHRTPMMRPSF